MSRGSHVRAIHIGCVLALGCTTPPSDECRTDIEELASITGERRTGCLTPDAVPLWAARSRVDDLETLGELVSPFDVGEGRWMKFVLESSTDPTWAYFINRAHFGPHWEFTRAIGCEDDWAPQRPLGEIGYFAGEESSGGAGAFYFTIDAHPLADYAGVVAVWQVLRDRLGVAGGELVYVPGDDEQREALDLERSLFDEAPFEVVEEISDSDSILALNDGVGYGRLRRLAPGEIPGPLDIAVFDVLPNDMPMVAGVITTTPQTALAHVNLRAIQDRVPNVYVPPDLAEELIAPLLARTVRLEVEGLLLDLREATESEVSRHLDARRPGEPQRPRLDLSVDEIRPLDALGFGDADSFGVKTANLAELGKLGLGAFVPEGVALPLRFYRDFMEQTGLATEVDDVLSDPSLADREIRSTRLDTLRTHIRDATMPSALRDALTRAHEGFPSGTSLRCRSSTNVEDLEEFSGAGLYRSYTHHPDEGHLSKSIQQVYASLWTERAYEQREFYRIDHTRAAMGVLIHPNFENETVNGVAVTDDVLYRWRDDIFYVNSQVGEDLVTNPEGGARPEELYLTPAHPEIDHFLVRPSSLSPDGALLMSEAQMAMLTRDLESIRAHFVDLYRPDAGLRFSMEVEFKITAEGQLAIKQARPWVYGQDREAPACLAAVPP